MESKSPERFPLRRVAAEVLLNRCGAAQGAKLTPDQQFFEQVERARISGLAQPEHGLLPDLGVAVGASDLDQGRDALVLRPLAGAAA